MVEDVQQPPPVEENVQALAMVSRPPPATAVEKMQARSVTSLFWYNTDATLKFDRLMYPLAPSLSRRKAPKQLDLWNKAGSGISL
jgi:hypothetical protein